MRRNFNLVIACLACGVVLATGALMSGRGGVAVTNAAGDVGYKDQAFPANANKSDFSPTGEKPQSKLWFNGGRWWASMLHSDSKYYIFYLDLNTQTWIKTNTPLDDRIATQADCLWDGTHLYVASGAGGTPGGVDLPARLYRYSYNPANPPETAYTLDVGFPVTIRNGGAETIVIDKDSTGQLWITYTQGNRVWINRSLGADNLWNPNTSPAQTAPFSPPNASGETDSAMVASDDISSLVAFNGKIGVIWSKQTPATDDNDTFYFAYHNDSDPDSTWQTGIAYRQPDISDDHINLKSVQTDGDGNLFVAVKTSVQTDGANDPRILVLRRNPAGSWSAAVFINQRENNVVMHHTRPILMIDSVNHRLYVFATDNTTGGPIVYKQSSNYSTDPLTFPPGRGTDFISIASISTLNNPTSTKQTINGVNGINSIVVLASGDTGATGRYYAHNALPLNVTLPPTSTPTKTSTPTSTPRPTSTPTKTPGSAPRPKLYMPLVQR
jgi:hypothetical protein